MSHIETPCNVSTYKWKTSGKNRVIFHYKYRNLFLATQRYEFSECLLITFCRHLYDIRYNTIKSFVTCTSSVGGPNLGRWWWQELVVDWHSRPVVTCLQEGIEDRLDVRRFPFLAGGSRSVGLGSAPVRYVRFFTIVCHQWHQEGGTLYPGPLYGPGDNLHVFL